MKPKKIKEVMDDILQDIEIKSMKFEIEILKKENEILKKKINETKKEK